MKPHIPTWLTVVVIAALIYWLFFRQKQALMNGASATAGVA